MNPMPAPATARGEATRRRLLNAAEEEFGEKGYHGASVSSITTRADTGQGTFYLYFRSKEEVFLTLVHDIGHQLRAHTAQAVAGSTKRLEAERRGLDAFFEFTTGHRGLYRIVQECQFVDDKVYRDYYEKLAEGYATGLAKAADTGDLLPGDAVTRAWAMMGIGHMVGMKWCLWQKRQPPASVVDEIMNMVTRGIGPKK